MTRCAFEVGDRVAVWDEYGDRWLGDAEIDGVYPPELEYDLILDDGRRFGRVSEVCLEEV